MLLDLYPYRASAHSGAMRLQLYKMQEEHLLKREAQRVANEVLNQPETPKDEQVERQATPQGTRKAKKRKPAVVEREEYPEVRFKRKPIYANPQPVAENLPMWVGLVSIEIDSWYSSIIPLWKEHCRVIISKQDAVNDSDSRLRLLLLVA